MASAQEISAAAQAYIDSVDVLATAQATYDFKEQVVQELIESEQQAVFDAQAALNAASLALEVARDTARSTLDGWAAALAAHQAAAAAHLNARNQLALVLPPFTPPD